MAFRWREHQAVGLHTDYNLTHFKKSLNTVFLPWLRPAFIKEDFQEKRSLRTASFFLDNLYDLHNEFLELFPGDFAVSVDV